MSTPPFVTTTTGLSYSPALAAGATYFWKIVAKNANGTGTSEAWSFTTASSGSGFPAPTQLSPSNGAGGVLVTTSFSWTPVSGSNGYDLYLGTTNPPAILVFTAGSPFLPVTALNAGTTYYWKVASRDPANSNAESASPVWSFTTTAGGSGCSITLASNPSGLTVQFDGISYVSPQTFGVTCGSSRSIAATSPQSGGQGTQYAWSNWSDGGLVSHTVTAPSSGNATYTANFATVYFLSMNAGPGGSVSPPSGWYNAGQAVQISATPNSSFTFGGWTGNGTGSYTGSSNPAGITMTGPTTETGAFAFAGAPTVNLQPLSQTICAGGGVTFTSTASGQPAPTVQWQVSTDGGTTYSNIVGATPSTLSFPSVLNNGLYRAVFTNLAGTATSNSALLTVNTAPSVSTVPASQTVSAGTAVSFTAAAAGSPAPTVQWQVSTDGGVTFSNMAGATAATLTLTATTGLNGNRYRAVFTNVCGLATSVAAVLVVTDTTAGALQLVTVAPCRIMDTRSNGNFGRAFGPPSLAANTRRTIPVPFSSCSIPSNATAYSLNITVVPKGGFLGYLTIWPTGQAQPNVSTLNSLDGSVLANAAIVPAGTGGSIDVFAPNDADVLIDINGYFAPPGVGTLQFYPLTPCRLIDTRNALGSFGGPALTGGTSRDFPVQSGPCGVPFAARAYSFNVTVVPRGFLGYLTAYPTGQAVPGVSTLNSIDGTVLANAAIVPAGTNGSVSFYAFNTTDVVVDINGYFAPPGAGGLNFYTSTPCRVVDTRNSAGSLGGPIMSGNTTRTFPLPASICGLPIIAAAYSMNVTVVPGGPLGYLTTWPAGQAQPNVSTLNAPKGLVVANAALVPAGTNGSVNVFVPQTTHVIIDTNGYFQ